LVLPWRARQAGSDAVEVLTRIAISDHICRRLWLAGNDEQGEDHRADDAKLKKKSPGATTTRKDAHAQAR
jgi:hypothetical protein